MHAPRPPSMGNRVAFRNCNSHNHDKMSNIFEFNSKTSVVIFPLNFIMVVTTVANVPMILKFYAKQLFCLWVMKMLI